LGLYKSTTTAKQPSSAQLHSPPQSLFQFHSILSENATPKRQFKSSTMLKTNLCVRNSTKSQTPDANLFDFDESFVIQCEGNPSLIFHRAYLETNWDLWGCMTYRNVSFVVWEWEIHTVTWASIFCELLDGLD
jgi:hypothetical protein